jgi:Initiator Replication protein
MRAAYRAAVEGEGAIIKARELVEAGLYGQRSLSLAARKTLNLLIAKAAGDAWADTCHQISKKELRGSHKANERIGSVLKELTTTTVQMSILSSRGRPATLTAVLVSWNIDEHSDDGLSMIEWEFSAPARALFQASHHFARLDRTTLLKFRSKYGLTLYEIACLVADRRIKRVTMTLQELRLLLGVPSNSLGNFANLKRVVLDVAKCEIEKLSEFTFDWKARTNPHGRVTGLDMWFSTNKSPVHLDAPKTQLSAIVSLPPALPQDFSFPSGSLHFGEVEELFGRIAVAYGGNWDRDRIADQYRVMMGKKLSALRGNALIKSFTGFCQSFVRRHGEAR